MVKNNMTKRSPKIVNAIEMNDITKIFGNKVANDNITLKVKKGEIHGIIGENGAGKSTLMSILFGLVEPTLGYILVDGKEKKIKNALDAEHLGIGMVHQHFKLIDIYNAIENIMLGSEITEHGFLSYKQARQKIQTLNDKYKFNINLGVPINSLSVGQQQKIEILKTLYRNSNILIFDEPTGVLTPQEIQEFLKLLKEFKQQGKTIILISHKLDEIKAVCDQATIIRHGKVVKVVNVKNTSIDKMSRLMIGKKIDNIKNRGKQFVKKEVIFSVRNLSREATRSSMKLSNINFDIHKGEILAIAGVEGNGQKELIDIITGLEDFNIKKHVKEYISNLKLQVKRNYIKEKQIAKKNNSQLKITKSKRKKINRKEIDKKIMENKPSIKIDNVEILDKSIHDKYKYGMAHIPADRHKYGLILNSELKNSLFLQEYNQKPFSKNGFLQDKEINKWTNNIIKNYDVRGSNNGESLARDLSGGNQQKAIIGRELSRKNKVVIIAQPTRGLDVGAINNVHKHILKLKEQGKGVLLISYELPEIFALADRILVISSGKISKELYPNKDSLNKIGLLMAGEKSSIKKTISKRIDSKKTNTKKKLVKKSKAKKGAK